MYMFIIIIINIQTSHCCCLAGMRFKVHCPRTNIVLAFGELAITHSWPDTTPIPSELRRTTQKKQVITGQHHLPMKCHLVFIR